MINFKPTYLYIKRHSVTGKCYFGKTVSKDPIKYKGSGISWTHHITQHGKEFVETLWYKLFTNKQECTHIALLFSEQQNIVNSELWMNKRAENGLHGGHLGHKESADIRAKRSALKKGIFQPQFQTPKAREKRINSLKGVPKTQKHKDAVSLSKMGHTMNDEGRAKMRAAHLTRWTPERRAEASRKQKLVVASRRENQ